MVYGCKNYREVLREELDRRVSENPAYSLNSFANALGLSKSHLSDVLNFKKGISAKKAEAISKLLRLNSAESRYFVNLVKMEHERSPAKRELARRNLSIYKQTHFSKIDFDKFAIVEDWYHFAIMELVKTKSFRRDPKKIAAKLGISESQAEKAIERLLNLGFLEMKLGKLKGVNKIVFETPSGIPSQSIRNYHKATLKKAIDSVESQTVKERHLFSTTMAIDSSKLKEAESLIVDFHKQLNELLTQTQSKKDRVYSFSSQLFSLEKSKQ